MFTHTDFRSLPFESVPVNRDVYLMDQRWMQDYEASRLRLFSGGGDSQVGQIGFVAVRSIGTESLELSWYPNIHDRFHEVAVRLPRGAFVTCVVLRGWDERPHIFVKSEWLASLHVRPYSAFALIDAIGVKTAIAHGTLTGQRLVHLRERIDEIAESSPQIAFVSFADSLLLKINWHVGLHGTSVKYTYQPESLIRLFPQLSAAFADELGLPIYAAIAQGVNEYEDPDLIHTSRSGNHISLNSLGLPFAQLLAMDDAVRSAIRAKRHQPSELYMDEHVYHSLRFRHGFEKHLEPHAPYSSPMSETPGEYFFMSADRVLSNLEDATS